MVSFKNDYSEGCIPEIMEYMLSTNSMQTVGYGEDEICLKAKHILHERLENDQCDIHFLMGGTQTNLTVIAATLRPYEAVIAVDSGHINVHETGAIEATGHKVIVVHGNEGKITPQGIIEACLLHEDEHMVKPAMVYISNATEVGTIYSKAELMAIKEVCRTYHLILFMDGARLGSALASEENDVQLKDLCNLCDVFYIGGTKNGALFGEAVVIIKESLKQNFRYMIKQRGGMLAKGRMLGIQFIGLFETDRFLPVAKHANKMAMVIQKAFEDLKYPLLIKTSTNQIFPILTKEIIAELSKTYQFQVWEKIDEQHIAIRFVTSWATKENEVHTFIKDLKQITYK